MIAMKKIVSFLVPLAVLLLFSCGRVYMSPEARSIAASHRLIAVVPPQVTLPANRKVEASALKEQQRTESLSFQREIHDWVLRRKMQGKIFVDVKDVETVNALLTQAGYFESRTLTPRELCELLEVDAVITSNFRMSKPMSEGAAVAVGLLTGIWGATNEVSVSMDLHDKGTGRMIWNFSHTLSGSTFSSPRQMVDELMRLASRNLPYRQ